MHDATLFVFDLSGTTVKDQGQVLDAFKAALDEHGIPFTDAQLSAVRGASKREAVQQFIPDDPHRAAQVYACFHDHLARRYDAGGVAAIDGAASLFERLRARGVRVALNTGFDRAITALLLDALGWWGTVDAVIDGDAVPAGRPAPYLIFRAMEATGTTNAGEVVNVGDTTLDLLAGHHARVGWNVGVLTGAHDRQRLSQAPHTHLLSSVAELSSLVFPASFSTLHRRKESHP